MGFLGDLGGVYWCDVVLTYRSFILVLLRFKVGFRRLRWELNFSLLVLMEA